MNNHLGPIQSNGKARMSSPVACTVYCTPTGDTQTKYKLLVGPISSIEPIYISPKDILSVTLVQHLIMVEVASWYG